MKLEDIKTIDVDPDVENLRSRVKNIEDRIEKGKRNFAIAKASALEIISQMEEENTSIEKKLNEDHEKAVAFARKNESKAPEKPTFKPKYSQDIIKYFEELRDKAQSYIDKLN